MSAGRKLSLIVFAAGLVPACAGDGVLSPEGPIGEANRTILLNSMAIMLAIVVPTLLAALGFAWWFRAGNAKAEYDPGFVFSGRIEVIVWSIPILTIMFLGGLIWIGSHQVDPRRPIASSVPPLEVQVVSLDWKWLFIYPGEGVASVNRLMLPVGRPAHFSLTSASVMNSFFVPRLGSQIYTMNGMATELNLRADRPGVFRGLSAHYSGDGFSGMHFAVEAVPEARFQEWVGQARDAGPPLDVRAYAQLARQSEDERPRTFRAVQPGLFDAVVHQMIPPAAGPNVGRGGPDVSPKDQR